MVVDSNKRSSIRFRCPPSRVRSSLPRDLLSPQVTALEVATGASGERSVPLPPTHRHPSNRTAATPMCDSPQRDLSSAQVTVQKRPQGTPGEQRTHHHATQNWASPPTGNRHHRPTTPTPGQPNTLAPSRRPDPPVRAATATHTTLAATHVGTHRHRFPPLSRRKQHPSPTQVHNIGQNGGDEQWVTTRPRRPAGW